MARGKYEDWLTVERLGQLRDWAQSGHSDQRIAERIGIAQPTLAQWKRSHGEIKEALEAGRKTADKQVENALLKRALGYSYMEKTYERVVDENGEEKMVVKKQVEKQVMPDLSAQAFWLKNRNPEKWKDKQDMRWEDKDITVKLTEDEDED